MPPPAAATLDCLGVSVTHWGWADFRSWFDASIAARGRAATLFFVNAHTLNLAWSIAGYRRVLNEATLVLNDGFGLELYARWRRRPFPYNFNGTDLFPRLLAERSQQGASLSVFLYGAKPGRAVAAGEALAKAYSAVKLVGALDGYGPSSDEVMEAVARARPDLLLVALGNPLQEQWIARNAPRLEAGVVAGVGALFDFLSGEMPRAPRLLRCMRLEWLYRLALEPRRMFRRYVVGNPLFLLRAVAYGRGRHA